jgi:glycosyltransferase 2 family protein
MAVDAGTPEVGGRPSPRLPGVLLKIAVAGGLLIYVFSKVDLRAVSRVIATVDPLMLALAVVLACLSYPSGGVRWWCIVRALGEEASPRLLTGLFWLAGLVAQVLPNPMGDAVRISVATRLGLRLGLAFRSAFLERVVMVAGLVFLMAATQPLLCARVHGPIPPGWVRPLRWQHSAGWCCWRVPTWCSRGSGGSG